MIAKALALRERGVAEPEILARFPEHRAALVEAFAMAAAFERAGTQAAPSKRLLHRILAELPAGSEPSPAVRQSRLRMFHVERLAFLVTAMVLVVFAAGMLRPGNKRSPAPSLSSSGTTNATIETAAPTNETQPDAPGEDGSGTAGNTNTALGIGPRGSAKPDGAQNENSATPAPSAPEDLTALLALETAFSDALATDASDETALDALATVENLESGLDAALAI